MAYQSVAPHAPVAGALTHAVRKTGDAVKAAFTAVVNLMVQTSLARTRMEVFQRLDAMSDDQLAQLNLKREDLVRHVFNVH